MLSSLESMWLTCLIGEGPGVIHPRCLCLKFTYSSTRLYDVKFRSKGVSNMIRTERIIFPQNSPILLYFPNIVCLP